MKVSVIITNYNYGKYIGRCIRSCLDQTLNKDDYEIIVVDDGSTDYSKHILDSFNDEIQVYCLSKNCGVSYASNYGIKKAKGMYVIRVDADDFINRNMLLFMSEILTWNKDIGFVYCDHIVINEFEERESRLRLNTLDILYDHGAGVMFRKSYLESIGLYDETLKNCEDFDLISRYLKQFDGYYLKIPLYRYFKHNRNMTNDKLDRETWKKKVLSKGEKRLT